MIIILVVLKIIPIHNSTNTKNKTTKTTSIKYLQEEKILAKLESINNKNKAKQTKYF